MSETTKRTKDIERLARDICWSEFMRPRGVGKTKAAYWNGVSAEKKAEYIRDTRHLILWVGRIPINALNKAHEMYPFGGSPKLRRTTRDARP